VDKRTAEVILAEIGTDMGRFSSAGHLASWAGLCPRQQRIGRQARLREEPQRLQVAADRPGPSCQRGRPRQGTYLAAQYARIKGRRGHQKAIVAVAHSILVIAWHLLTRNEPYSDLGADYFMDRQSSQAHANRLIRQLERMNHKVTLEPADTA
jgi:transposase